MGFEPGKPVQEFGNAVYKIIEDACDLWRGRKKRDVRYPRLTAHRMIAATSAALIGVVLLAAAYFDPAAVAEGLVIVARTVLMWGVFGVVIFGYAKLFRGVGTVSQTLAATYKVMPIAYVAGAIGAVVVAIAVQAYSDNVKFVMATGASILAQTAVIGLFLPRRISHLHQLSKLGGLAMNVLPLVVLAVNVQFAAVPAYRAMTLEHQSNLESPLNQEAKLRPYWPVLAPRIAEMKPRYWPVLYV